MNETTAKIVLNVSDFQELDDAWDTAFFEHKQYFLTKVPLPALFENRLKKLRMSTEAYTLLSQEVFTEAKMMIPDELNFKAENFVLDAFNRYQHRRMSFKQYIAQTNSPMDLETVVSQWVKLEQNWYGVWSNSISEMEANSVVIGKEPDPMVLLSAIKEWAASSDLPIFSRLHSDFSFLSDVLKDEVKRLTLLHQKKQE
jgi:hypothetical protein